MESLNSEKSTSVLSFCTLSHKNVWIRASELIPKFLLADQYLLYVPDDQVEQFKKITSNKFKILPESILCKDFFSSLKIKVAKAKNSSRFNWYLQQFLKLEALITNEAENLIIWDSDCIPLDEIILFADSKPIYMKSSEFHKPYFKLINKVLKIKKMQNHSFIIPGFPIPKSWVKELICEIENMNHGKKWHEVLIDNIDFSLECGFSEFELLGTWVFNRHLNEFKYANYNWERFGQSKYGLISNLSSESLLNIGKNQDLDIISFENWDTPVLLNNSSVKTNRFLNRFRLHKCS